MPTKKEIIAERRVKFDLARQVEDEVRMTRAVARAEEMRQAEAARIAALEAEQQRIAEALRQKVLEMEAAAERRRQDEERRATEERQKILERLKEQREAELRSAYAARIALEAALRMKAQKEQEEKEEALRVHKLKRYLSPLAMKVFEQLEETDAKLKILESFDTLRDFEVLVRARPNPSP